MTRLSESDFAALCEDVRELCANDTNSFISTMAEEYRKQGEHHIAAAIEHELERRREEREALKFKLGWFNLRSWWPQSKAHAH